MKSKKIPFGKDLDTYYVRYSSNIKDSEKIIGLTQFIENEYDKIISFASLLFCDLDISMEIKKIPIVLKKEKPTKTYHINNKTKAQMIKSLFDRYGDGVDEDQIHDIINRNLLVTSIGGTYCSSDEFIEIFYTNLDQTSVKRFFVVVAQVLAHELMHYIHDKFSPLFNDSYKECHIVKEAIAEYFSFLYLINCNEDERLQVSYEQFLLWNLRLMSPWIYAYALFFLFLDGWTMYSYDYIQYENNGSIDKFIRVLKTSKINMYEAFSILLADTRTFEYVN